MLCLRQLKFFEILYWYYCLEPLSLLEWCLIIISIIIVITRILL